MNGFSLAVKSADFPGVAREVLREKLGRKVHTQFVQGLAGDVRPRAVADLANNRFRAATPDDLKKPRMTWRMTFWSRSKIKATFFP